MDLFRKKSVDQLVSESTPLKRTLKTFDLTMLGIGAIIGTLIVIGTLPGALIGYALGLFLGQYWETPDWQKATKATLGGLAGYGLSAIIQFGGGLIILIIFLIAIL